MEENPINIDVNTHNNLPDPQVISSGEAPSAEGILANKRGQNFSFLSLTKVNKITACTPASVNVQTPGRCALTLHWILNPAGQKNLRQIAKTLLKMSRPKNIYHLSEVLDQNADLKQLYRLGF